MCACVVPLLPHPITNRARSIPSTAAIILDHEFLDTEYAATLAAVQAIIERLLRENMRTAAIAAGLNVRYYSWTQINYDKDFTAVVSVSDCASTWRTFEKVRRESLVYIAFTEPDCARLPSALAITIPIVAVGQELAQILLDVRTSNAIGWKSAVLLYDESFGQFGLARRFDIISKMHFESLRKQS